MRVTLIELGHPQFPTPICTNNSTANGIMNATITQNRSKATDIRFYWLHDRVEQGQLHIYWAPGSINLAYYFTKHHSPSHHLRLGPLYLHKPTIPNDIQGVLNFSHSPKRASTNSSTQTLKY